MSKAKDAKKATDPGPEIPGKCNALRRSGRRCKQAAGRGTPHVGVGPCKECAGSTPNVVKRYARLEAVAQAREFLDSEEDIDPLDAALTNVKIASTIVRFQQARIRALSDSELTPEDVKALEDAVLLSQRVADVAIRAGVAERLVSIAERAGEQLALICEAGLAALAEAGVKISPAQRTAYAEAVQAAGEGFEQESPLRLLPGAA